MITNYGCLKQFSNKAFRETLTNNLASEEFFYNDKGLQRFFIYGFDAYFTKPLQTFLVMKECMTSMKIFQLSRPPTPIVHLRPNFFGPLNLGRPISKEPPPPPPHSK